ncbi:ubiquitin C-terminal hydrolase-like protein [Polyplosphaeria fusca]|uniref:Ubiquitin C-terminal hydrolase-like protein n=1 Tax=Polyplosphaeria fusca TaxID=682080 RepID=A0A9P4QMA6_9PLEO|nr:ubiquitin C-terminal hydrolase-like protein [Polyplosphaeria fusca]
MSPVDHDQLMESASADPGAFTAAAAAAVTASPPRRDSMEDADDSLTRKRPRLDDGSAGNHGMDPHTNTAPGQAPEQVQMTIRSQHPPFSQSPAVADHEAMAAGADPQPGSGPDMPQQEPDSILLPSSSAIDPAADSPPVIAIDDDDDDDDEDDPADTMEDFLLSNADNFYAQFPFTHGHNGSYIGALRAITGHVQGGNAVDGTVIPQLTLWLHGFPNRPSHWDAYYGDYALFWDEFAQLTNKILYRRFPFGESFCVEGETEEEVFTAFLKEYLTLCSRLLAVDANRLSESIDASESPILITKHLRLLYVALRSDKCPLFHLLVKDYGIDVDEMSFKLLRAFICVPTNGVQNLLRFTTAAYDTLTVASKGNIATYAAQLLQTLGSYIYSGIPDCELPFTYEDFQEDVLQFFRSYSADLQNPSKVSDVGVARDLLSCLTTLLQDICLWDADTAQGLADEFLDFRDPESPTASSENGETALRSQPFRDNAKSLPFLISNAWRFKLLRKYLVKGRMELRVVSINIMDHALVEIWKENNGAEFGNEHPLMQYLADFLLHERVVEYIISVDSHPQIISRSGNVVGFLVVTNRYAEAQTDAIWNTVANSQDPRVVVATMTMLRSICNLMMAKELRYLCSKLYDLPIDSYTVDTLRFLRDISHKMQQKAVLWDPALPKERPWNVCIRIMQDTAPNRQSTKLTHALHAEACEHLRSLCAHVIGDERSRIFEECASHIANRSPDKATGSIRAMHVLATSGGHSDFTYLKQNPDITRQILEEICSFIDTEKQLEIHTSQTVALQYRLDYFCLLIHRAPETIPESLYQEVWDHLLGKYALNNYVRDTAWSKFSDTARMRPENAFCRRLITDYVPKLEPQYFTSGLFEFVANIRFQATRSAEGDNHVLQIPGAELLWPLMLTAPPNTIEDQCARLLAARYIEIDGDSGMTLEEAEDSHVALVDRCTHELLSSYKALRGHIDQSGDCEPENTSTLNNADTMDLVVDAKFQDGESKYGSILAHSDLELRFARTLLFEKLLLTSIRTKPEFSRSRRSDSKIEASFEPEGAFGDGIQIRYQAGNDKQTIWLGNENTITDLYTRICHATGYSKINLFHGGQKINMAEIGDSKIGDASLGGLILVQKAPGSEISQPYSETQGSCSVFETTILKHFEKLFACMDSDDFISGVLFDFLSCFPFRDRIPDAVMSGTATGNDIFPPGKVFQAKYAAHALQYKLRDQLRRGTLDEKLLANSVRLLDHSLLNESLVNKTFSGRHALYLASVLVEVLLEFLKERPSQDLSSQYFSNESALVDGLVDLMSVALTTEQCSPFVASNSFATILEASLHSKAIWEAFMSRPDIPALHRTLLLADPRQTVREDVAKSIASVCGGDLPSTSPLSRIETSDRFWRIISSILPESVQHPTQSEQLFDIAEQVFRSNDENTRDEESLRSFLMSWSNLLLSYEHKEFVGRDDIDYVVLGFTKLLLCCVPSLKSFKKPLNAGSLMEHIFRKFLFVPQLIEIDDGAFTPPASLPVLESKTRKELYDLMLALAEDRRSYSTLLNLAESLSEVEDPMLAWKSFAVSRLDEIRSSTGYVGLFNPRAICYMNSLITQLFMNVNFRKFMLSQSVADDASQHLLHETQKLFAFMQNIYRKAADPREFASYVKGLDGLPIDINIQMDADEFYNLLFDQWEGQMLSETTKQQFRSFYGGQTVNQIKSKECEHVSERVESFFVVQCDVQGKANLQESLQAFVEGDVMEGDNKYKCESCGGKFVDAVKRTCLKDVPDNLIFHLKRFDFDLVDMRRAKINDLFEFPTQIDVSLYNVDHLSDPTKPREEDLFELVGVLVHTGNSENGHYYSYIRERPCPSGSMTSWVEFNDRDVDRFDHQSIPFQAFGGCFTDQYGRDQPKQYSAYMLFYQRKSAIEKDHCEYISSPQCGPPKVPISQALEEEIARENETFVREYSLFDPNHSRFIRQILTTLRTVNHGGCSEDHQQETQALHVVLEHLCQIIIRQRNLENFDETMLQIRKTVFPCTVCCQIALKWLASRNTALTSLLLRCPHLKVRSQVRMFLIEGLRHLREKDPALYGTENVETDMDAGPTVPVGGILLDMVNRLRILAKECGQITKGWEDFHLALCQLSDMGPIETAVMLNHGFLEHCLRIFCMHASTHLRYDDPDIWRVLDQKKKPPMNRLIELVYTLLSKIDIRLPPVSYSTDRLEKYDRASGRFPLTTRELDFLTYWDEGTSALAVLDKLIEYFDPTKTEIYYPGETIKWMLESREARMHYNVAQTIAEGISAVQPPYSDPYVRAAITYCQVCRTDDEAKRIVDIVAKTTPDLNHDGFEVRLQFFSSLLAHQNGMLVGSGSPNYFYLLAITRLRYYAIPMLMSDDDRIRKASAKYLEDLFLKAKPNDAVNDVATLKHKYTAARRLLGETSKRIIHEHEASTARIFMQPMIAVNHMLVQLIFTIMSSEDPSMSQFKAQGDMALIQEYQLEVESRLTIWPPEDDTTLSAGEAYEHSEYGSESDDGPELES